LFKTNYIQKDTNFYTFYIRKLKFRHTIRLKLKDNNKDKQLRTFYKLKIKIYNLNHSTIKIFIPLKQ